MRLVFLFIIASVFSSQAQSDTIPFNLTTFNNIIVHATLNETHELDLMFHSDVNALSLTKKAVERIKDQKPLKTTKVLSWGGYAQTKFSENNTMKIAGYEWDSLKVWISDHSGQFSDGKFGPNLFEGNIIELNFDISKMIIHKELPGELRAYSKLDLIIENESMYIEGVCIKDGKAYENRFLIHSGYGGTLLLDNEFASESKMNTLKIIDQSELKDSYGRVLKKKKAILPEFDLETFDFKALPIGFFEGKIGNERRSVLGGEILKRFNIVFDIENSHIYIKSNSLMDLPFKDL